MEKMIIEIMLDTFGETPKSISRKKIGLRNEVFEVIFDKQEAVIIRIGKNSNQLVGSSRYIPLFHSLGITVPVILKEDYSLESHPYPYHIQTKIDGQDLEKIFNTLTFLELKKVAKFVSDVFTKLVTLPTDGCFGIVDYQAVGSHSSWKDFIRSLLKEIEESESIKHHIDKILVAKTFEIIHSYEEYFDTVSSEFFTHDISSKNIMIYNGKVMGLVDLDVMCFGDPLFSLGSIVATWPDSKRGMYYINEIYKNLHLTFEKIKIVEMYAIFQRLWWLSEIGKKFNDNTVKVVDRNIISAGSSILDILISKYEEKKFFEYKMKNITYNKEYPKMFLKERKKILSLFGENVQVFHIGSTAIPEMSGKGIIDILIVVPAFKMAVVSEELLASGLLLRENAGSSGRIFFSDKPLEASNVRFHYHLVRENTPDHLNPIKFRDYLIAHPDTAGEYQALKETLAQNSATSREYLEGKAEFIQSILNK
ncbi:MAG: GrpB family protein [bacterium]